MTHYTIDKRYISDMLNNWYISLISRMTYALRFNLYHCFIYQTLYTSNSHTYYYNVKWKCTRATC